MAAKAKGWVGLARPFTLLAPTVGFLAGAVAAARGAPPAASYLGAAAAAALNVASNTINQIYDLEIDRINKPGRPLPSGTVSLSGAWRFAALFHLLALGLAWLVNLPFFLIVVFTSAVVYAYSAPPFRTKRWGIPANLTIALPRGCLLMVSGWTSVSGDVMNAEAWFIGLIFGLYVLGAATTKDFSDMKGDAAHGCRTLPVVLGVKRSVLVITPFFVLPFVLMGWGAWSGRLTGSLPGLLGLSAGLSLWGAYVAYLLLRRPEALAVEANHVSWKHMYLLMVAAQAGLAAAYWGAS
jgi:4-hydroxybenzoate polyprenyltransferase